MGEGLLARARRVVEAGVGSVVETAERLTGPGLMRQAVRDADHAVDDARRQHRRASGRAAQAAERTRLADEQAKKLEAEARYAVALGRDDLAAAAIGRKQVAEADARGARVQQGLASDEATELEAVIAALADRHRALAEELRTHEAAVKAASASPGPQFDDRLTRAEQSFARAQSAAGGIDGARGAGELEMLRRNRAIADELAALKAGLDAGTPGSTAKRARKG